jgi:hypothetical protein
VTTSAINLLLLQLRNAVEQFDGFAVARPERFFGSAAPFPRDKLTD